MLPLSRALGTALPRALSATNLKASPFKLVPRQLSTSPASPPSSSSPTKPSQHVSPLNLPPHKPSLSTQSPPPPPPHPQDQQPPPDHEPNSSSQSSSSSGPNPNGNQNEPHWLGHPFRLALHTLKFVAFAHLFWEYGFSMAPASGPSMLPTFELLGEWLVVSKSHRLGRNISVGDLVVYNIPINEEFGVKRVLGMPGDYVLMDTPEYGNSDENNTHHNMIQVPQGHCWIVGDNLPASRDSRVFGPVPLALIRGKVIASMIPFSGFKWIKNPLQKAEESSLQT